jgi:hypothetical protein
MGRTLGPFTDVSTARVDGAYEIYQGNDDDGREVEILTLGAASSKDPARRALLSDTVAWAHATRGPADAPILSADLESEQPYVVTVRQAGLRGVERMLERMLAMGPRTGPLPVVNGPHTTQLPAVGTATGHIPVLSGHTDPRGIPPVVSTPPSGSPVAPASPMSSYVTRAQRSRPPWLVPVVLVLAVLILGTGGFLVYNGFSGDSGDGSADGDHGQTQSDSQPEGSGQPSGDLPQWSSATQSTSAGPKTFTSADGKVNAEPGWPIAFKIPDQMACDFNPNLEATCHGGSPDMPSVTIAVTKCPGDCAAKDRKNVKDGWDFPSPTNVDKFTVLSTLDDTSRTTVQLGRIFHPPFNGETLGAKLVLTVTAKGPTTAEDNAQRIVNDLLTQTPVP